MSDRKYSQRGYQDSGRDERPARQPGGPRDPSRGPRGRGLGKPTGSVFKCAVCGKRCSVDDLQHDSVCGSCGADLHSCTHCSHFDSSVPNQCREADAEYVSSKAKRNLCAHFSPRRTQEIGGTSSEKPKDPRAAFDALFD